MPRLSSKGLANFAKQVEIHVGRQVRECGRAWVRKLCVKIAKDA